MRIAYILYDDITLLDFIGIYDPLSRLRSMNFIPDLSWDICANKESIIDHFELEIKANRIANDLSEYDMIVVPGGFGTRELQKDATYIDWLKTAAPVEYKVSICTGALLLGAAGFLTGKRATTHFNNYDELQPYCKEVMKTRIVDDHHTITAGAVSASIDLGLFLCEELGGIDCRLSIQKMMNYQTYNPEIHQFDD